MNVLQRLDELIEESREIEAQAEELQAGGPLHSANSYAVAQFQKQSETWYASVLELLPPDLRERFKHEWTGPEGDCGPRHFVSDPTGEDPHGQQVYSDEYLQTIDPTKVLFAFPFERCFREPLRRQRRILGEAKYHTDIARPGRRDALVQTHLAFHYLHPRIVDAAGSLFADEHFRNAIFEASIALTEAVKEKSEVSERDGTSLMQFVFSVDKPILRVSDDKDERLGAMWLFTGAVMGVRNPRGHHLRTGEDLDVTQAFEWLAFISALMRMVDQSERVVIAEDAP